MKTVYHLFVKDVIRFVNDKPAMILTFIVPAVLIVIFGNIFGGSGGNRGRIDLIFVNGSQSILAKMLEEKLDTSKSIHLIKTYVPENGIDTLRIDEKTAINMIKSGKSSSAALVMPKDFFADTSSALKFKFYYDPKSEIESALIQGTVQEIIMSQIPKVFPILMKRKAVKYLGKDSSNQFITGIGKITEKYFNVPIDTFMNQLTVADSSALKSSFSDTSKTSESIMSGLVKFDSEQLVGKEISNPGLTRTVGGWSIMFLLFSLTGAATSMFEEKQEGTLKRLLCMPITRTQILWSKYLYTMALGIVQLLVLFGFSSILFNVDIFSNFFNLLIVIVASAAAAVSFGMLITSMAMSLNQASGISTLLILVMSALGGSWFPIYFLPNWMQTISKFTLTYWSVEAFLQVLWRQSSFSGIAINVLILFSIALLVNYYSIIRFKKRGML